jgi:hypothetical protein
MSLSKQAWPFFIKSQQTILLATQFVTAVGRAVEGAHAKLTQHNRTPDISVQPMDRHQTLFYGSRSHSRILLEANVQDQIKQVGA